MSESGVIELLLRARDDASGVIRGVATEVTGLEGGLGSLLGKAGAFGAIAAGAVAAAGAVFAAGRSFANMVEQLDRTATNTGVATDRLQIMQQIVEEAGGNADALPTALMKLNKAIEEGDPVLKRLGITTKDTFSAFRQLSDSLLASGDAAARDYVAMKLLGRTGAEMVSDIRAISQNYDEASARMREFGIVTSDEAKQGAGALDTELDKLGTEWKGLTRLLQEAVLPLAIPIVAFFRNITEAAVGTARAVADMVNVLGEIPDNDYKGDQHTGVLRRDKAGNVIGWAPAPTEDYAIEATAARRPDPLRGIADADGKGGASPREKRLREIEALLHVGRAAAERYAAALDAIDAADKRAKLIGRLGEAGVDAGTLVDDGSLSFTEAFGAKQRRKTASPFVADGKVGDPAEYYRNLQRVLATAPRVSEAVLDIATKWAGMSADMTTGAATLDASLGALWSGMETGGARVFSGLLQQGQTFKSGWETYWKSLADSALQELNRILMAKLFRLALNAIPGVGSALSVSPFDVGGWSPVAIGPRAASRASTTVVVNANVSAFDAAGVAGALTSPNGPLRTAMRRVAAGGRVG